MTREKEKDRQFVKRFLINFIWILTIAVLIVMIVFGNERFAHNDSKELLSGIENYGESGVTEKPTEPLLPTATVMPSQPPTPTLTLTPTLTPTQPITPFPTLTPTIIPTPTPIPTQSPMLAITFDDGPYSSNTEKILDVLERYSSKATFFVVGYHVKTYYKSMQRAYSLGCEIGNHSMDHKRFTELLPEEITAEVKQLDELLYSYGIDKISLFRPTYGDMSEEMKALIEYPLITWSVDSLDYVSQDKDKIIAEVMKAEDGDIILMHDIHSATAEAAEEFIPMLVEKGFRLVTVSELFEAKGIELKKGISYRSAN